MEEPKYSPLINVVERPEDSSILRGYLFQNGDKRITIEIADSFALSTAPVGMLADGKGEIVLAEYSAETNVITTYPYTVKLGSAYFGEKKYDRLNKVSFERTAAMVIEESPESPYLTVPSGFIGDPFEGFGLIFMLRFIANEVEQYRQVDELRICLDEKPSLDGSVFRLPLSLYHSARKTMNRVHLAAVDFANDEKRTFLRNALVPDNVSILSRPVAQRNIEDLKEVLTAAVTKTGRSSARRVSNETAAVRAIRTSAASILAEHPEELFALNRKIELVTLEDLIERFDRRLQDGTLNEGSWQKFLSSNPFILRLAFGLPAVVFKEQMPVGGLSFDNNGGKIADFVLKSGSLGNLAIVEIKTPNTNLLGKIYRGGVNLPSSSLNGSVTQVLDQRYQLQQNLNQLIANSGPVDVAAYAIGCIVIAGISPSKKAEIKSFELFRSNLRDVLNITFDELLEKLRALHAFLIGNDTLDPAASEGREPDERSLSEIDPSDMEEDDSELIFGDEDFEELDDDEEYDDDDDIIG